MSVMDDVNVPYDYEVTINKNQDIQIPKYLKETYWWAYVHPKAIRFFERQWLVNLILFGNYKKLRDHAQAAIGDIKNGHVLQMACVYGDFSAKLRTLLPANTHVDIVDVVADQLKNARRKLGHESNISLWCQDTTSLSFANQSYECVVLFFLLHEQPLSVRKKTLQEAFRVTKPGGKVVIVDYHRPETYHPVRLLIYPILKYLEPFALDLWRNEILDWFPDDSQHEPIQKQTFFGGLYQQLVIHKK